jgi:eukaryotic-like serine/threonine-protein kinase
MMDEDSNTRTHFDAAYWQRVNAALDRAFDLDDASRANYLGELSRTDAALADEVHRLLSRAIAKSPADSVASVTANVGSYEPLKTALVRPGLTTELATVFQRGETLAGGFDDLLHRALVNEKKRARYEHHAGDICGAWRLTRVIGTGGMGEVWLAERADGLYQAQAAVKFLRTDANIDAFTARFAQERALLARLNHPGIARLLDAGVRGDLPFLVLEYVQGLPLLNYIIEHAPLLEQRLRIFRAVVEAISYAHTQLVVHRDLKPSNVLVSDAGQVKLLDFGVAGLLAGDDSEETTESVATRIAGRGLTVEYAAPEQISGDATGVASDVYSLGALGYHLLAGRRAHLPEKAGRAALEHAVLHNDPDRLSVAASANHRVTARDNIPPPSDAYRIDADLDAIFARAMRREPESRYRTADELLSDLRRHAERRPIAARREDRAYRTRLWLRRNWLPTTLAATLAIALVAGLGVSLWQAERARAEAARANKTSDYLVELLRGADPDLNGGQWPTAMSLLERARSDVAETFRDDPATEARLSALIASTYRRLSRDTEGLPIAQRAFELARRLHGDDAIETALAQSTLAESLYWLEQEAESIKHSDAALRILQAKLPVSDERVRRAQLNHANTLARLFRFEESERVFQAHFQSLSNTASDRWARAVADADYARALTAQGRWGDAYATLARNEAIYNTPPRGQEKIALHNRQTLVSTQAVLGRYDGVEARMLAMLEDWKRLAGPTSAQVFELYNELGYLYYRLGEGEKAERAYVSLRELQDKLTDFEPIRKWSTDVDLLEIRLMFGRSPPATLAGDARVLSETVQRNTRASSERGIWLMTRLAMVFDACGDAAGARALLNRAREVARETQLADGPWARRIARAEAGIDRRVGAQGTHPDGDAVSRLKQSLERTEAAQSGGFSQRLIGAYLEYALALATERGSADANAASAVSKARQTLPPTIAPEHYARALVDYVDTVVSSGQESDAAKSRKAALAKALGHRDPTSILSPVPSFFFM